MPEEVVSDDGVRLAVEARGEGEPVTVVAHGLTGSRHDFAVFAPLMPGTLVLFDFRGHGDSERPGPGSYSMDHFAADVDAVARAYGATGVVGASLGGGATLRLLCSDPDRFEKLVVLLPARLERDAPARRRLLRQAEVLERHPIEEAAEILLAEETEEAALGGFATGPEMRRAALLRMNGEGLPWAIREVIEDPPVRDPEPLRRVSAEALVVGQEGDPVHRADVARELAATLPKAELIVYPDREALIRGIPDLVGRVASLLAGTAQR